MHLVLKIPELLDMVMDGLCKDSLAKLARTCRLFYPTAAARLWKATSTNMFTTLLHEILDEPTSNRSDDDEPQASIWLPATEARWLRFHEYTTLIHSLELNYSFHSGTERLRAAYPELEAISCCYPILPQLRILHFLARDETDLEFAVHFLKPSLDDLTLYQYGSSEWGSALDVFLDRVAEMVPKLKRMTLHVYLRYGSRRSGPMARLLNKLPSLSYLQASSAVLGQTVLPALASLPSLHELYMECPLVGDSSATDEGLDMSPIGTDSFPSLRKLQLTGGESLTALFLGSLPNPGRLEELSMWCLTAPMPSTTLKHFITSIPAHCHQLRKLHLTFDNPEVVGGCVLWELFSALLGCRNITHFEFCHNARGTNPRFDLRNSHVEGIARSWPLLEQIIFFWTETGAFFGLVDPRALTLSALEHFAVNCPRLRVIKFSYLNASGTPPTLSRTSICTDVVRLRIWKGLVDEPTRVAGYLHQLWPFIDVTGPRNMGGWEAVNSELEAIRDHGH